MQTETKPKVNHHRLSFIGADSASLEILAKYSRLGIADANICLSETKMGGDRCLPDAVEERIEEDHDYSNKQRERTTLPGSKKFS